MIKIQLPDNSIREYQAGICGMDIAKDISEGGVLIAPDIHLSIHEYVTMTLFHRKLTVPIRTNGKVVRVDSAGVGIQFDQVIPAMASL